MRLVKASEMQEMDRVSIHESGISGVVLMENAARGATRIFLEHFNPPPNSQILILCGRGNNGGDGYVMARYLHQKGLKVTVIVLSKMNLITGEALINLDIIRNMAIDVLETPDKKSFERVMDLVGGCDFLIDGIIGTGLNSPVRDFFGEVIEAINGSAKPIMAIDIPSGLNADTGQIMGVAVKADLTVTFGFPKVGQVIYPGYDYVGRLARIDIGITDEAIAKVPAQYHLTEPVDFDYLFRGDKQDIHKGNRGHLLILAGSTGKTGAAALTALGALRAGAGLVTLGVPENLNTILEAKLTEAMTEPLPATEDGSLSVEAEGRIKALMEGKTAVALGPGLSTNDETVTLVRRLVENCDLPMVIDADGLNALSGALSVLNKSCDRTILTPHPGEMARLTGLKSANLQADRVGAALEFVERHKCFLVLKGARTLIADPAGSLYINPTGNPALSSGGSGDVLTGLIGGFLARGWTPDKAALAGVYMHGMAADFLAEDMGQCGIMASELLDVLPGLKENLADGDWPLETPPLHEDFCHPL